jgi:hypothetical protein
MQNHVAHLRTLAPKCLRPVVALAAAMLALLHPTPAAAADDGLLCNPNSTTQARALMKYLKSVYGTGIISGQMNDKYLTYIQETTGKSPAMMGYDFNGICPGQSGNNDAAKAIAWVKTQGGIAQFQWHWISPDGNGDFYTKNFNLGAALADKNSQSYKNILRDIDLAAVEVRKMQDAGVPILWRPLHEAEGAWFWWGMSGKAACIELYRLIYDRFVNYHSLNNIIWVWTSYGVTKGSNWYPGDDVVDLIVWDYPSYISPGGSWDHYNAIFGTKGKLFGIGEDGKLFDPALLATQGWLYFMTWSYMVETPEMNKDGKNSKAWLTQVYNDPRVITLEDVAIVDTENVVPPVHLDSPSKPVNISTRGRAGPGESDYMIAGFIIEGPDPQTVLVRAVGPGLRRFGVSTAANDPIVRVIAADNTVVAENDNHVSAVAPIAKSVGAFTLQVGSLDAATVLTLAPGSYTAIVRTKGEAGTVLVEVYEVD